MMDTSRACAKVQFSGASTKQNAEPVLGSSSKSTESKLSYSLHIKDLPVLIFPSVFMQDTSKFHDMFKYKSQ